MHQTHCVLSGSHTYALHHKQTAQQREMQSSIKKNIHRRLILLKWIVNKTFIGRKHYLVRACLVVTAVIMVWRGIWQLLDIYFLPEAPVTNSILSVAIGFFLLFLDDFRLTEVE